MGREAMLFPISVQIGEEKVSKAPCGYEKSSPASGMKKDHPGICHLPRAKYSTSPPYSMACATATCPLLGFPHGTSREQGQSICLLSSMFAEWRMRFVEEDVEVKLKLKITFTLTFHSSVGHVTAESQEIDLWMKAYHLTFVSLIMLICIKSVLQAAWNSFGTSWLINRVWGGLRE